MLNWTQKIQEGWLNENNAAVVSKWYEVDAQDSNTLVYYGANPGFSYYIRQNKSFSDSIEDNVTYMDWYSNKTQEEYTEYINSVYGAEWPDELYLVATHFGGDIYTIIRVFTDSGYIREDVYNVQEYDTNNVGLLIRLSLE